MPSRTGHRSPLKSPLKVALRFLLLLLLLMPLHLWAHPMGNFSVNHYTAISLEKTGVRLRYFIDLAEIPTFQELQQYNITPSDTAAQPAFLLKRGGELQQGLSLRIDGTSAPLHLVSQAILFPAGAGGLPTMKLGYVFMAAYPHSPASPAKHQLSYSDANFPGHAGWKEIIVRGPASLLLSTSLPATDRSSELTNYPTDMLNTPPQDLSATAEIQIPQLAPVPATTTPLLHAKPFRAPQTEVSVILPSAPGTSRTAMAHHNTKLLVRQQAVKQTVRPAAQQTAPHPAPNAEAQATSPQPLAMQANRQQTSRSAFTQLITNQHLSLWFLLTAALISIGLGGLHALEPGHGKTIVAAYLVGSRGTARHAFLLGSIVTLTHTASVFALGAITLYASRYILPEQLYPWLGVLSGLSIALLGGYLFIRRFSGLEVEHSHVAGQPHGHWFSRKPSTALPANKFAPVAVTEARPQIVSTAQLFTLGITGGIIPCPAALVVLLSAFSLHRVGFGFFLITAFSVGLAAVLIGFGLVMVYARRLVARFQTETDLTRRWLPMVSAACMAILGFVIAARAFTTTGLTWHSFSPKTVGPALFVAGLGLVLGIRHSTDTDHVVAISTIVTKERSIRGAALLGSLWGLGHTITIFLVGCLIILFGVVIPTRVGLSMEFSVALMLILLGLLNLTGLMQRIVLFFRPKPEAIAPLPSAPTGRLRSMTTYQYLRPLAIGLVHGLAGSAAVALLVLSTIHNPLWAIVYLVIFGAGTMFGMMAMTAAMAMPLVYAGDRLPKISHYLGIASGLVSVCFGSFLVYQLGFLGGLFTSHPHWTPQ
jgi:nickel/cobalt exporter